MSTSQRSGRGNGKGNGIKKQRVGTPGGTGRGVGFEAAFLEATPTTPRAASGGAGGEAGGGGAAGNKGNGSESEGMDTFSYDDVSNLATVTPVVPKRAVSRAAGVGHEQKKRPPPPLPPPQQQQAGKGKKRAADNLGQAGASTARREEGESGSRAAKRRKQQKQAAAAAAAITPNHSDRATSTPARSRENKHASSDSNGDANGGAQAVVAAEASAAGASAVGASATGASAAEGVTGVAQQEAAAARGRRSENTGEAGAASVVADPRGAGALSSKPKQPEQKGGSKPKSVRQGKTGDGKRGGQAMKPARKVPRYPRIDFEGSRGKAGSMADALRIAVAAEVQGLLRKRGKEPDCKVGVQACVDAGKEIIRQATEICAGLEPAPMRDLKAIRRIVSEYHRRRLAEITDEEELWAIEEQKCMALAERNKRVKADVQAFDARRSRGHPPSLAGGEELRSLLGPMYGEDEESSLSDGAEICNRVSKQVFEWTNDMSANTRAISSVLRVMGNGVADAQDTKEKLAQVFSKVAFKNYPNAHDPKAGIAAMLK